MSKLLSTLLIIILSINLNFGVSLMAQTSNQSSQSSNKPLCSLDTPTNFSGSRNQHLLKLNQYQNICRSKISSELMVFLPTPTSLDSAVEISIDLFNNAKTFAKYGISPLVIMEPTDIEGNLISFRQLANGKHNHWMSLMFGNLMKLGLTASELGTIVLLPEANTPIWNFAGTKDSDFSIIFNNLASSIKNQYPTAKLSLMLNSSSYAPSDIDWGNPLNKSYLDYIRNIKQGYLSSVGLQGFPYISRRTKKLFKINEPKNYLPVDKIAEVANFFNIKRIWINTGSFVEKYSAEAEKQTISTTELLWQTQRTAELAGNLQQKGYNVSVNYFLADKMSLGEQTNWSMLNPKYHSVFINIVKQLNSRKIRLSIFDA
jgi:hypothetical protein